MMIGGLIWTTAGGNKAQTDKAKSCIKGAVLGVLLLMFAHLFLRTINPELVTFKSLTIKTISQQKDEAQAHLQALKTSKCDKYNNSMIDPNGKRITVQGVDDVSGCTSAGCAYLGQGLCISKEGADAIKQSPGAQIKVDTSKIKQ